jgi:hypothetical protein
MEQVLSTSIDLLNGQQSRYNQLLAECRSKLQKALNARAISGAYSFLRSDAPQALMTIQANAVIVDCNEALATYMRLTRDRILSTPEFFSGVCAQGLGTFRTLLPAALKHGMVEAQDVVFPTLNAVNDMVARVHYEVEPGPDGRIRRVPRCLLVIAVNIRPLEVALSKPPRPQFRSITVHPESNQIDFNSPSLSLSDWQPLKLRSEDAGARHASGHAADVVPSWRQYAMPVVDVIQAIHPSKRSRLDDNEPVLSDPSSLSMHSNAPLATASHVPYVHTTASAPYNAATFTNHHMHLPGHSTIQQFLPPPTSLPTADWLPNAVASMQAPAATLGYRLPGATAVSASSGASIGSSDNTGGLAHLPASVACFDGTMPHHSTNQADFPMFNTDPTTPFYADVPGNSNLLRVPNASPSPSSVDTIGITPALTFTPFPVDDGSLTASASNEYGPLPTSYMDHMSSNSCGSITQESPANFATLAIAAIGYGVSGSHPSPFPLDQRAPNHFNTNPMHGGSYCTDWCEVDHHR